MPSKVYKDYKIYWDTITTIDTSATDVLTRNP